MGVNKKIKAVLGTAAIGTLLGGGGGGGGSALAAFIQNPRVDSGRGRPETFFAATVTGSQAGTLLPGESAIVTLALTNPNSNVKARLVSVAPGEVFIDSVSDPTDAAYCHGQIVLSTVAVDPLMPTLAVSEVNFPFAVRDAVKLMEDTDARCQDMTFRTTWAARFHAVP